MFNQNKSKVSTGHGGAYYQNGLSKETVTMTGVEFTGNEAKYGAGLYVGAGHVDISDYTFTGNKTTSRNRGSGIYWNPTGSIKLTIDDMSRTSDTALQNYLDEPTDNWLDLLAGE